ncbi:hypothetical protein AGMMS4956_19500 [Bacteroidia bacterium]|nr:hypothetical protein AGMMS4956_19500 [Bacteroidia bacterium]
MITYQVQINEELPLGKSIITLLKSASEAVTFKKVAAKSAVKEKSAMYRRLDSGFHDVREILDGKQKKQTLGEFLNEI